MGVDELQFLVAKLLALGKARDPRHFPRPTVETTHAWTTEIARSHYPQWIWLDAFDALLDTLAQHPELGVVGASDLKQAAKTALVRAESHPAKRNQLNAWRQARRDQRDEWIKTGTFAQNRGYTLPKTPNDIGNPPKLAPANVIEVVNHSQK